MECKRQKPFLRWAKFDESKRFTDSSCNLQGKVVFTSKSLVMVGDFVIHSLRDLEPEAPRPLNPTAGSLAELARERCNLKMRWQAAAAARGVKRRRILEGSNGSGRVACFSVCPPESDSLMSEPALFYLRQADPFSPV